MTPKMTKKRLSLKKGVWLLLYSPNQNFLGHAVFARCQVSMRTVQTQNFVKILRAVFEIWTKNIKNAPKMGFFPICDPPRFFFKNRALSLLYPYGALTSCKKLEKSLERSLRYLKTDGLRTTTTDYGRTWVITQDPSRVNPGSKTRNSIQTIKTCCKK